MVDWSKGVRGRFRKVKRIEWADSTQVARRREALDRLLRLMAEIADTDWCYENVFISDQSSVSDFLREESEVAALSKRLGFGIDRREYLIHVALRMEPKQ